jgi:hypothetical protein
VSEFVRGKLENSFGGLTPLDVVNGHTAPQLMAVWSREPKGKARAREVDPGALAPGEVMIDSAELARIIARRKAAANGPTTPKRP